MTGVTDFQRESHRIDERIWDALALRRDERALFLGVANDGAWIARAVEIGVLSTALASDDAALARIESTGATVMRGSATMIPATENAFDVAIAMHYLHEIDPGFHPHVVQELGRVARRVAIVEPSPPADPLGKRIAALYGRAKRDAGQFEGYQPLEYWRKLLAVVKADVWQNLFTFTRVPPQAAVSETISLILDAMAIEEMPSRYLDELRALAARKDAQLLPLSRIVLVGTAAGEPLQSGSGEPFRPYAGPPAGTLAAGASALPGIAPPAPRTPVASPGPPPPSFGFAAEAPPSFGASAPSAAPFAAPTPTAPPAAVPAPPPVHGRSPGPEKPAKPVKRPSEPPPAVQGPPFGAPFAVPETPADEPPFGASANQPSTGFGWSWEPPEESDRPPEP